MTPRFQKGDDYTDLPISEFEKSEFNEYIPVEVFHYTSLQTGLEKILLNKTLLLREITRTNDPRESKTRPFHDVNWGVGFGFGNPVGIGLSIENPEITGEWRVFCTSCSYYPPSNFVEEYAAAQRNNELGDHHMYGLSYSKMWAQYGGNHSGLCFVFDGEKLNGEIENRFRDQKYKTHHGFVRYDYEKSVRGLPPSPDLEINDSDAGNRLRHYQDKYYADYFLYKSREWQSEHEFRWLVHSKDRNEEMKIPIENSIKAVVVGIDCSPAYHWSTKTLCDNLGIPIYKMRFWTGRPRADLPEIN